MTHWEWLLQEWRRERERSVEYMRARDAAKAAMRAQPEPPRPVFPWVLAP